MASSSAAADLTMTPPQNSLTTQAQDSMLKRKPQFDDDDDDNRNSSCSSLTTTSTTTTTTKKPKQDDDDNDDAIHINNNNSEQNLSNNSSSANNNDPNFGGAVVIEIEAHAADDKGSRHSMEDTWLLLPFDSSPLRCAHFAIYDGHGGRLAAEYVQKRLHSNVLSAGLPRELLDVKAAKKAILDGFRITDDALLLESAAGGWQDGATAVCVWVLGQTVFVANIGDAKAVIARSTSTEDQNNSNDRGPLKAIVLTREHKAIYPQERARIQKAGGSVSTNGRLQGRLEVSRAFGDRHFKKVGVIATPHIQSFDLTEKDHFIILGCDGLWGVLGPSDAVNFVNKLLNDGVPVASVCRRLVRDAVLERGCKDNCTVIVIVFRRR